MLSLVRLTPTDRDLSGMELPRIPSSVMEDSMVLFSAHHSYRHDYETSWI